METEIESAKKKIRIAPLKNLILNKRRNSKIETLGLMKRATGKIKNDNDEFEVEDPNLFVQFIGILNIEPELRTPEDISVVSGILKFTDLLEKFKKEKEIIESSYTFLLFKCCQHMKVIRLEKNQILFKIDDVADNFYIILFGQVSILRPELNDPKFLTAAEYLKILIDLEERKETHLLNKNIQSNVDTLFFKDIEEFKETVNIIVRYLFLIEGHKNETIEKVEQVFNCYNRSLVDLKVNIKELRKLAKNNSNWVEYLKVKFELSEIEREKYLKNINLILNDKTKYEFRIMGYEKFLSLRAGKYFGDFGLDSDNKKRTATIKAESECYLGYITNKFYEIYIQTEKQKIRNKEIAFINDSYFFKHIPQIIFNRRYFSFFASHDYNKGHRIYKIGKPSKNAILIKEGLIELNYEGSLIELQNLICNLSQKFLDLNNAILNRNLFQISSNHIQILNDYISNDSFNNLRNKSQNFIKDINTKKNFQFAIMSAKDYFGMEEIFLGEEFRFLNAFVQSEKAKIYKIKKKDLHRIFDSEMKCVPQYHKYISTKIMSLLNRLSCIKQTMVNKYLQESKIIEQENTKKHLELEKLNNKDKCDVKIIKKIINTSNFFSNRDSLIDIHLNKINTNYLNTSREDSIEDQMNYEKLIFLTTDSLEKNNLQSKQEQFRKISTNEKGTQITPFVRDKFHYINTEENSEYSLHNRGKNKLYYDSCVLEKVKNKILDFKSKSIITNLKIREEQTFITKENDIYKNYNTEESSNKISSLPKFPKIISVTNLLDYEEKIKNTRSNKKLKPLSTPRFKSPIHSKSISQLNPSVKKVNHYSKLSINQVDIDIKAENIDSSNRGSELFKSKATVKYIKDYYEKIKKKGVFSLITPKNAIVKKQLIRKKV